jgi:hypothetical protein
MGLMKIYQGRRDVRSRLNGFEPDAFFAVESELSKNLTYIERDGEFAVCYGSNAVVFDMKAWQEMVEILNERNMTKYGIRPEV